METGLKVQVPQFIQEGEVLRIDTRECKYAKKDIIVSLFKRPARCDLIFISKFLILLRNKPVPVTDA
jgi:hypothetical protein